MTRFVILVVASLALVGHLANASEIILRNDASPAVGKLGSIDAGTRLGVLLTVPSDGTIVGVKILWGSANGGAAPSQQAAISISSDTLLNPPNAPLAQILSPTLIDGGANEFRYLDPGVNSQPLSVPVFAGQILMVDLQYATSVPNSGPGIWYDAALQLGKNALYIPNLTPYWVDAQLGSLAGDLGIQAIFQPVPEPGTLTLVALGMVGVLAVRRARSTKNL